MGLKLAIINDAPPSRHNKRLHFAYTFDGYRQLIAALGPLDDPMLVEKVKEQQQLHKFCEAHIKEGK